MAVLGCRVGACLRRRTSSSRTSPPRPGKVSRMMPPPIVEGGGALRGADSNDPLDDWYSPNLKRFYTKDAACTPAGVCPTPDANQPSNKITFPFPRLTPDPSRLKTLAQNNPRTSTAWACPSAAPSTCTPPWDTTLFPNNAADDQVVFVDAKNNTLNLDIGNQSTGVLVVWCGSLTLYSPYKGIIVNMYGNGTAFGATDCSSDPSKGIFTLATANNENVQAWVFSNGGIPAIPPTPGIPGITFNDDTELKAVPGGGDLASIAFGSNASPPTSFEIEGWPELYE